jgi:hypothetical protein
MLTKQLREMERQAILQQPLFIVISNFNSNNPYAEKRTPWTGTWSEAVEEVKKLRAENPGWYVGIKMPC